MFKHQILFLHSLLKFRGYLYRPEEKEGRGNASHSMCTTLFSFFSVRGLHVHFKSLIKILCLNP